MMFAPQSADSAAVCGAVRSSITELCSLDHLGDQVTLDAWLADKTRESFRTGRFR